MSNRESIIQNEIHSWKGVDQRSQPTLVPQGYVTNARGCFFGLGENAERLPGKRLAGKLDGPIFMLFSFEDATLIQTLDTLYIVPTIELLELAIINNLHVILDSDGEFVRDSDGETVEDTH